MYAANFIMRPAKPRMHAIALESLCQPWMTLVLYRHARASRPSAAACGLPVPTYWQALRFCKYCQNNCQNLRTAQTVAGRKSERVPSRTSHITSRTVGTVHVTGVTPHTSHLKSLVTVLAVKWVFEYTDELTVPYAAAAAASTAAAMLLLLLLCIVCCCFC
jgi:hypothetical protein